jgi:hypothetical protein
MAGGGQGAQSSGQVYGGMPIGNAHAPQSNAFTQEVKYPQAMPMQGMANPFNPDGTLEQRSYQGPIMQRPMTGQITPTPNPYGGQVAPALPQAPSGGIASLLGNQGVDVIVHGQPYNQGNGQQMMNFAPNAIGQGPMPDMVRYS